MTDGLCCCSAHTEPPQTHSRTLGQPGKGREEPEGRQQQGLRSLSQAEPGPELGRQNSEPPPSPNSPFIPTASAGKALWLSPQRTGCSGADGKVVPPGHTISSPAARAELPAPPVTAEHTSPFTPEQGGSCKTHREAFRSCRNKLLAAGTCFTL